MKLLLTSAGIKNPSIREALVERAHRVHRGMALMCSGDI